MNIDFIVDFTAIEEKNMECVKNFGDNVCIKETNIEITFVMYDGGSETLWR